MTGQAWYVLAIVAGAAVLGGSGLADVDAVGIFIWLALAFGRALPLQALLAGFGSEAVVLVGAMMVVAEGLRRVGALRRFDDLVLSRFAGGERRARLSLAWSGAIMAALLESTAATVGVLPVVARVAARRALRPSRLYLIAAFGVMAGGLLTLIGTSGNLVANSVLAGVGQRGFGFLELAPLGLGLALLLAIYAATLAGRLGPAAREGDLGSLLAAFRGYLGEVRVEPGSPAAGRRIREAGLRDAGVDILAVIRGGRRLDDPGPDLTLEAGDVLVVVGPAGGVAGLTRIAEVPEIGDVAEGLLPPDSTLAGRALARLGGPLAGLHVLGVWRHGQTMTGRLASTVLRPGDVLLLRGDRDALEGLQRRGDIAWLGPVSPTAASGSRLALALAVAGAFFAVAVTGAADIAVAAVAAAGVMIVGRCLAAEDAYGAIRWKVLILLAGAVPLGVAIGTSGLGTVVADMLLRVGLAIGWRAALAALALVTTLLTQVLSNVPATAVMTPVAIHLATGVGLPPKACVAVVLVAALCTPLTPLASKPAVLVREAGGYRASDYLRLGAPFAVAAIAFAVLAAPALWPGAA